jgi:hypothetical protein
VGFDLSVDLGMRTGLAHQHVVHTMRAQVQDKQFLAVQVISSNEQRKLWVLLTSSRHEAFGGFDLTILFVVAIFVSPLFHIYGLHPMRPRFDQWARDHRMAQVHLARTVTALQPTWALQAGGRKIVAASQHQRVGGALICPP